MSQQEVAPTTTHRVLFQNMEAWEKLCKYVTVHYSGCSTTAVQYGCMVGNLPWAGYNYPPRYVTAPEPRAAGGPGTNNRSDLLDPSDCSTAQGLYHGDLLDPSDWPLYIALGP